MNIQTAKEIRDLAKEEAQRTYEAALAAAMSEAGIDDTATEVSVHANPILSRAHSRAISALFDAYTAADAAFDQAVWGTGQ